MNKIIQEQYEFPFVKEIDNKKINKEFPAQYFTDLIYSIPKKDEVSDWDKSFLDGFPSIV